MPQLRTHQLRTQLQVAAGLAVAAVADMKAAVMVDGTNL